MGKIIKQYYCKGNNRRISIELHYYEEEKKCLVLIQIKNLQSYKLRVINNFKQWYSIETFCLLQSLINCFIDAEFESFIYPEKLKAKVSVFNEIEKYINHDNSIRN